MAAADPAVRRTLNGGSTHSIAESPLLRPAVAAVVIPLAALVLLYPRQSLRLLSRAAMTLQAFRLGLKLKDELSGFMEKV